jgi:hypothetical protein
MAHMFKLSKQLTISALWVVFAVTSIEARTTETPQTSITLSWDNASPLILGHKIAVALSNGAVVEGKVLSVDSDTLDLQISKTSDSQIQPKGKIAIPRASLHTLKLIKPQKKWRIILTSAGAGTMIPLWVVSKASYNEVGGFQPPPLPATMAIGGSVGYLAGWWLDGHHDVTITIH